MSIGGYKIRDKEAIHFITFAVVEWVDVFTRKLYRDIVVDSLRHCQEQKGLLLHGWVIMSNHVHLLASAKDANLSDILRDFKKYTSKQIIAAIQANDKESRKDWMLKIFTEQGEENSRNKTYQFWRQENQPKECYSPAFMLQKLNYIHNNPVEAGLVEKPGDYLYSSARNYLASGSSLLEIIMIQRTLQTPRERLRKEARIKHFYLRLEDFKNKEFQDKYMFHSPAVSCQNLRLQN